MTLLQLWRGRVSRDASLSFSVGIVGIAKDLSCFSMLESASKAVYGLHRRKRGCHLPKSRFHSVVRAVPMWRPWISHVGSCLLCIGGVLGVPGEGKPGDRGISDGPCRLSKPWTKGFGRPGIAFYRTGSIHGSGRMMSYVPKDFLMTKMNGLIVMASHFGLRGRNTIRNGNPAYSRRRNHARERGRSSAKPRPLPITVTSS